MFTVLPLWCVLNEYYVTACLSSMLTKGRRDGELRHRAAEESETAAPPKAAEESESAAPPEAAEESEKAAPSDAVEEPQSETAAPPAK